MPGSAVIDRPIVAPIASQAPWRVPPVVRVVSPRRSRLWDAYVHDHELGTFFHTWTWREAVRGAFRHEPLYLEAAEEDQVVGVLPLFLVNSRFGGRRLVSVPYGVGGGILADNHFIARALFDAARKIGTERDCPAIELRSERADVASLPVIDRYFGFRKRLPQRVEDVLGGLPRKARAAARNARHKYGLAVVEGDVHLRAAWRLYTVSMRRLGSLAYPYRFFEALIGLTPGSHRVSLVRRRGRTVAGLVTFFYRDTVMPYFIGTTRAARTCSAANLIYLDAMEHGVADGFTVFDFGRSRKGNAGSYDFKRFNGFEPRSLAYQTYVAPGAATADLTPDNRRFRLARAAWRHLPLCVTRAVGSRLTRHIPG